MTRYNLVRLAQVSAAALAAGVLTGALAQATWAGLASTVRLLAVLGACGVVVSAGWHGTAAVLERREERKRAERRHRVPRPDRGTSQPSMAERPPTQAASATRTGPESEPTRDPQIEQAFHDFEQAADPYLAPPSARWASGTGAGLYDDLYARNPASPA